MNCPSPSLQESAGKEQSWDCDRKVSFPDNTGESNQRAAFRSTKFPISHRNSFPGHLSRIRRPRDTRIPENGVPSQGWGLDGFSAPPLRRDTSPCKQPFLFLLTFRFPRDSEAISLPIDGLRSFTAAHPALELLSRDEHSGQTDWKQPVSRFETHPDVLHHLSIYAHGDGRPDKTLSGTAPHPFWVEQDQAFVLLGDLKPSVSSTAPGAVPLWSSIIQGNEPLRGCLLAVQACSCDASILPASSALRRKRISAQT